MYTPRSYRVSDANVLHGLIRKYSFGTLYNSTPLGAVATHLPFLLDTERGEKGVLIAHMARANHHWRSLEGGQESMAVFVGPHSYISPNWYVRPDDVPTWNYAAVHAYGVPRIVEDADILRKHVLLLAAKYEDELDAPWDPTNIESQMGSLLKALVGFEIPIGKLEGTFKFNQNRSREDRAGVVSVLEKSSEPLVQEVAAIMHRELHDLPLLEGTAR